MLEFNKVLEQVQKMGKMLDKLDFDVTDLLALAEERFNLAGDTDAVRERIAWIRGTDITGYRGAAPLNLPDAEPLNLRVDPPAPVDAATIIAVDGSQVYPDEQSPVHYYLVNIGAYVYYHGTDMLPEQYTFPDLVYNPKHVQDKYNRLIRNNVVNDRRTIAEMEFLGHFAWQRHETTRIQPLIALYDNRLLYSPGDEANSTDRFQRRFWDAMRQVQDAGALLVGYLDNTFATKRFVQFLYLMSLNSEDEAKRNQHLFTSAGDLDGLRDQQFFNYILEPGQRSAVMVQNFYLNRAYADEGHEIAYFYLKVYNDHQTRVVRVDIPVWVAQYPRAVEVIHSVLLEQCRIQGRNPYPYAITRADELAVVKMKDRDKLDEMVRAELRKRGIHSGAYSAKTRGKDLARSEKRKFKSLTQG